MAGPLWGLASIFGSEVPAGQVNELGPFDAVIHNCGRLGESYLRPVTVNGCCKNVSL